MLPRHFEINPNGHYYKNVQNLIVIFPEVEVSIASYHTLLPVGIAFAAEYVQTRYPNDCRVVILPKGFSTDIVALLQEEL